MEEGGVGGIDRLMGVIGRVGGDSWGRVVIGVG